ncbi:hypothetical protein BSG1_04720 [Bacillus sp. SG-1]|nr:hypothetical protein BSG1_04720 [Bacillus sp. SG-1]
MHSKVKRILTYVGYCIISTLFVFATGFNGERVENQQELTNAFPMETGFPLNFAELRYPRIDPPLPWNYGGNCCSLFITSQTNFWLSVIIVFIFLIVITEIVIRLIKKFSPN